MLTCPEFEFIPTEFKKVYPFLRKITRFTKPSRFSKPWLKLKFPRFFKLKI